MIQWVQLPLWLMQSNISATSILIYTLLANRYKLSVKTNAATGQWSDEYGIYCIFPRAELAKLSGISINTVTRSIRELVNAGLIIDRRLGQGIPNRIYIIDRLSTEEDPIMEEVEQLQLAACKPEEEADPAAHPAEQDEEPAEPETAEHTAHQTDSSRITGAVNQESQSLGFPYIKKKIKNKYSDRSDKPSEKNIDATILHCLQTAYGDDPDSVTPDQLATAYARYTRASVTILNPIAYIAAILHNMISATPPSPEDAPLADWEIKWIAEVNEYIKNQKSQNKP